jgi:hypothetical protein
MNIPVRIVLHTALSNPICSFVVHVPFVYFPTVGSKLLIDYNNQSELLCVTVCEICHFLPTDKLDEASCLIITSPLVIEDYDKMLNILDWLKSIYKVDDFNSYVAPESYYVFYRNLINVLGIVDDPSPKILYDAISIKIFAECCRSIILASCELNDDELSLSAQYNQVIEELHMMVLDRKRDEVDGADMLQVVKKFEDLINKNKTMNWDLSIDRCIAIASRILGRLSSIPVEALPKQLRI